MAGPLRVDIITVFPGMLDGFLNESILKRAAGKGLVRVRGIDLREFTRDAHRTTDDRPYGGGPGMVMKPEPIFEAFESLGAEGARCLLMSPRGRRFDQKLAVELSRAEHLVVICGHYEGVDERVRLGLHAEEVSIGDYILTNGVLAAAVIVDAVVRLLPGALGCGDSAADESFADGYLEYPQYTRPPEYRGMRVPDVLLSGNHDEIRRWRRCRAEAETREKRPDLLKGTETDHDVESHRQDK